MINKDITPIIIKICRGSLIVSATSVALMDYIMEDKLNFNYVLGCLVFLYLLKD